MPTSTSFGRRSRGNTSDLRNKSDLVDIGRVRQFLTPGAIIGRTYRVHHKIATGGMGEVWAGEHLVLRLRVAMKVLRREALAIPEVVARFQREAFLLAQIHSEHVVRVIDFVHGRQGQVLVMEFVEGPALTGVLTSRRFAVEEAIELGMDIASALREVHAASVVHRDVKPANIILRPLRDGSHRAVFVDLGVSRMVANGRDDDDLTEITADHRALGTVEYMAPEQILCSRDVTPAADLYSLGAILFRAVAGHNVFSEHGADLLRVKLTSDPPPLDTGRGDRVARGFEALVARLLTRRPEDRYESADELLADLSLLRDSARRVVTEQKLKSAPPPPPTPRLEPSKSRASFLMWPPSLRRSWRWRAAAGVALTVVAVAATVGARAISHANDPQAVHGASDRTPHDVAPKAVSDLGSVLATGHCTLLAHDAALASADGHRHMSLSLVCEEPPSGAVDAPNQVHALRGP